MLIGCSFSAFTLTELSVGLPLLTMYSQSNPAAALPAKIVLTASFSSKVTTTALDCVLPSAFSLGSWGLMATIVTEVGPAFCLANIPNRLLMSRSV